MINHTPLYHELYKFTNEYKTNESKHLVNKFLFKPSVENTDGFDFINSNTLYSSKLDVIPNAKIYTNTYKNRYNSKNIRVCNIPFSEFGNYNFILKKLTDYMCNSIKLTEEGYVSSLDYFNRNKNKLNKLDVYKKSNGEINKLSPAQLYSWAFREISNIEFNSIEFYKATGIYLLITRRKISNTKDEINSSFINNNYDLGDGLNIRIRINGSSLEVNFVEQHTDDIMDDLYQIELYTNPDNTYLNLNSELFDSEFGIFAFTPIIKYEKNIGDLGLSSPEFMFKYDSQIYKPLMDIRLSISAFNPNLNWQSSYCHIRLYDHEYSYKYIKIENESYVKICLNPDTLERIKLVIPNPLSYDFEIRIAKYNFSNNVLELKDYLKEYNVDSSYYKSTPINQDMSLDAISSIVSNDENNLRNCLPFSLEYLLDKKSTFKISKLKKVLYKNIEFKNSVPCIKFTLNSKHDTVMFFKGSKLLSPTYIESNGSNYNIYLSIKNMLSNDEFEKLRKMIYGVLSPSTYIDLNVDDLWIVYDTDRHFIENMRYDINSVYKYINISTSQRYSINIDGAGNQSYIGDDNGEYIKYKSNYLELGADDYYIDNKGNYTKIKPDNYDGNIYRKTKTNEYLLPLNKDIDPTKIVIVIEDYHTHEDSDSHYTKDPDGLYILLNEDRYYQTYDLENKSSLYIKINNEYLKYNENEHLSYKGSFYIKKEAGYVVPPYYYAEDIRYRKIGKKCVVLSNVFNFTYDSEIVSVDSYYRDNNDLIETRTHDKDSLIDSMLYKKYGLTYPINDSYYIDSNGDYKLYNSNESVKSYKFNSNGDITESDSLNLFYKNNSGYIDKDSVDGYVSEITQFIDMNRVYKFTLNNKEILDIDYEEREQISIDGRTSDTIEYIFIDGRTSDVDDEIMLIDCGNSTYKAKYSYGEVLDGGYADTDEYMSMIDAGYATSYTSYPTISKDDAISAINNGENVYIDINGRPVLYDMYMYPDYTGPFYYDFSNGIDLNDNYINDELFIDDDYPVYDFNFSSPYSIQDDKIKAYRIDSSYSSYIMNSNDEFLSYVIPNQLINSENKLMTFIDGKFTDKYIINKNLYSRLFGGDTILSITDDPEDYTGKEFSYRIDANGDYYFDDKLNTYVYDPSRDTSVVDILSYATYYKCKDSEDYIDSELYDSNDIVSYTTYIKVSDTVYISDDMGTYYKLKNGNYIDINNYIVNKPIESYQKYYQLKNKYNDSYYISTHDYYIYTIPYSKNISTVFMCNMKNLSLYQNSRGITYSNKIFTVENSMDTVIHNERQLYRNIYFPPLSLRYMIFFINGKFANPYIRIITPQRFIISDDSFLDENENIKDIQIYAYDNYLYNLNRYNMFFTTDEEINNFYGYNMYVYNDNMWDTYGDAIRNNIKSNDSIHERIYKPIDSEDGVKTSFTSLYEIFGKYILNKYDIDNDYTLHDEIREYFAPLFDENNRMKLELIQNKKNRKFIY